MARNKFEPTQDQRVAVLVMAACGNRHENICRAVINPETDRPIDMKTLRLAFADELEEATACANAMVAQSLFQKAVGDGPQSVTAAIFWLKARARWSDQPVIAVDAEEMEAQVRATIAKALADDHGDSAAVH